MESTVVKPPVCKINFRTNIKRKPAGSAKAPNGPRSDGSKLSAGTTTGSRAALHPAKALEGAASQEGCLPSASCGGTRPDEQNADVIKRKDGQKGTPDTRLNGDLDGKATKKSCAAKEKVGSSTKGTPRKEDVKKAEAHTGDTQSQSETESSSYSVKSKDGSTDLIWPSSGLRETSTLPPIKYACNPLYKERDVVKQVLKSLMNKVKAKMSRKSGKGSSAKTTAAPSVAAPPVEGTVLNPEKLGNPPAEENVTLFKKVSMNKQYRRKNSLDEEVSEEEPVDEKTKSEKKKPKKSKKSKKSRRLDKDKHKEHSAALGSKSAKLGYSKGEKKKKSKHHKKSKKSAKKESKGSKISHHHKFKGDNPTSGTSRASAGQPQSSVGGGPSSVAHSSPATTSSKGKGTETKQSSDPKGQSITPKTGPQPRIEMVVSGDSDIDGVPLPPSPGSVASKSTPGKSSSAGKKRKGSSTGSSSHRPGSGQKGEAHKVEGPAAEDGLGPGQSKKIKLEFKGGPSGGAKLKGLVKGTTSMPQKSKWDTSSDEEGPRKKRTSTLSKYRFSGDEEEVSGQNAPKKDAPAKVQHNHSKSSSRSAVHGSSAHTGIKEAGHSHKQSKSAPGTLAPNTSNESTADTSKSTDKLSGTTKTTPPSASGGPSSNGKALDQPSTSTSQDQRPSRRRSRSWSSASSRSHSRSPYSDRSYSASRSRSRSRGRRRHRRDRSYSHSSSSYSDRSYSRGSSRSYSRSPSRYRKRQGSGGGSTRGRYRRRQHRSYSRSRSSSYSSHSRSRSRSFSRSKSRSYSRSPSRRRSWRGRSRGKRGGDSDRTQANKKVTIPNKGKQFPMVNPDALLLGLQPKPKLVKPEPIKQLQATVENKMAAAKSEGQGSGDLLEVFQKAAESAGSTHMVPRQVHQPNMGSFIGPVRPGDGPPQTALLNPEEDIPLPQGPPVSAVLTIVTPSQPIMEGDNSEAYRALQEKATLHAQGKKTVSLGSPGTPTLSLPTPTPHPLGGLALAGPGLPHGAAVGPAGLLQSLPLYGQGGLAAPHPHLTPGHPLYAAALHQQQSNMESLLEAHAANHTPGSSEGGLPDQDQDQSATAPHEAVIQSYANQIIMSQQKAHNPPPGAAVYSQAGTPAGLQGAPVMIAGSAAGGATSPSLQAQLQQLQQMHAAQMQAQAVHPQAQALQQAHAIQQAQMAHAQAAQMQMAQAQALQARMQQHHQVAALAQAQQMGLAGAGHPALMHPGMHMVPTSHGALAAQQLMQAQQPRMQLVQLPNGQLAQVPTAPAAAPMVQVLVPRFHHPPM